MKPVKLLANLIVSGGPRDGQVLKLFESDDGCNVLPDNGTTIEVDDHHYTLVRNPDKPNDEDCEVSFTAKW